MLDALLEKLNLKYENLSAEERKTYEQWATVLGGKDMTIEDVRTFLASEGARANEELMKWENSPAKELYYKALSHLIEMLQRFVVTPGLQRDALKTHLREVFHIDV